MRRNGEPVPEPQDRHTTLYPILIEEPATAETAWGVTVPDLPGCCSAADTLKAALEAVKEAMAAWVAAARDEGIAIPRPSAPEAVRVPEGWLLGLVEIE